MSQVECSEDELKGKVAIVTGAARGMGKAIAKRLAEAGATVILNDVKYNSEQLKLLGKEIEIGGGNAFVFEADVSDYQQVSQMVNTVLQRYGQIGILVNNAGILRRRASIEEIDEKEWDLVMAVNVKGVFNCSKAVLEIMKKRRYGKIVNISSSAGRSTSELGGAHYTASKAAVLGLSRHLARESAPYGINVNAICPGLIDTPMVRETTTSEELEKWRKVIPMGRLGTPEEVADLVLFLVSEKSSYINGATIDIGGASLLI
ncbi:MAG: SDR family NAD(P)-dependent oxidoreductase [Nitrososphaeria archaeon]